MKTTFGNLQNEVEIDRASVRRLVSSLALSERFRGREVAIIFVDDSYMRELKGRYLGVKKATDVLAFPLSDSREAPRPGARGDAPSRSSSGGGSGASGPLAGADDLLGEVYISAERAVDQARRHRIALSEEVARLIVHGLLHLFGYRDDTPSSRREMVRRQESFLRANKTLAGVVAKAAGRRRAVRRP